MKKAVFAGIFGMVLMLAGVSAAAGSGHYYYGSHGHGGHYYHRGDHALVAAGIIGGAILLGAILSQPRHVHVHSYYAPPPYPPPPYGYYRGARPCYQDQVWRYLPDGRIQTGTRTTCY